MLTGRLFSQRLDRSKPLWELWLVQGLEDNRFAVDQQDAPLPGGRGVRRGHHHGAVRHLADSDARRAGAMDAGAGAVRRGAGREGRGGHRAFPAAARAPRAARRTSSDRDVRRAARGGRGARQHRVEVREPAAPDAAERADRPAPAGAVDPHAADGPEVDQERARWNRERRVPRRRVRCAGAHAAAARCAHRGPRAARHRPGVRARGGPARRPRQPHHGDARSAARVRGRSAWSACAS